METCLSYQSSLQYLCWILPQQNAGQCGQGGRDQAVPGPHQPLVQHSYHQNLGMPEHWLDQEHWLTVQLIDWATLSFSLRALSELTVLDAAETEVPLSRMALWNTCWDKWEIWIYVGFCQPSSLYFTNWFSPSPILKNKPLEHFTL